MIDDVIDNTGEGRARRESGSGPGSSPGFGSGFVSDFDCTNAYSEKTGMAVKQ
ncbi:hypothetical protein ACFYY1_02960 [Streptomyces sp. NPDC001890]|uniref:hypothetical protein n=1 Tax=Streptomyces sp. NPDC001890 TaxID=3364620 RepID=UPI00368CF998